MNSTSPQFQRAFLFRPVAGVGVTQKQLDVHRDGLEEKLRDADPEGAAVATSLHLAMANPDIRSVFGLTGQDAVRLEARLDRFEQEYQASLPDILKGQAPDVLEPGPAMNAGFTELSYPDLSLIRSAFIRAQDVIESVRRTRREAIVLSAAQQSWRTENPPRPDRQIPFSWSRSRDKV